MAVLFETWLGTGQTPAGVVDDGARAFDCWLGLNAPLDTMDAPHWRTATETVIAAETIGNRTIVLSEATVLADSVNLDFGGPVLLTEVWDTYLDIVQPLSEVAANMPSSVDTYLSAHRPLTVSVLPPPVPTMLAATDAATVAGTQALVVEIETTEVSSFIEAAAVDTGVAPPIVADVFDAWLDDVSALNDLIGVAEEAWDTYRADMRPFTTTLASDTAPVTARSDTDTVTMIEDADVLSVSRAIVSWAEIEIPQAAPNTPKSDTGAVTVAGTQSLVAVLTASDAAAMNEIAQVLASNTQTLTVNDAAALSEATSLVATIEATDDEFVATETPDIVALLEDTEVSTMSDQRLRIDDGEGSLTDGLIQQITRFGFALGRRLGFF